MRPIRPCAVAAIVLSLLAAYALPAQAACKRFGFLVNDYGKEGPTNDAKALLDKHIKKWANEKGITDYQIGKKHVTCELYLDVGLFDEYTCTAKASVCWGDDQASAVADNDANNDDELEMPPAPVRKTAVEPKTAVPVAAAEDTADEDAPKTAEQAAEEAQAAAKAAAVAAETAVMEAAAASKDKPTKAAQGAASTTSDETAAEASETATAKPAAAPTSNVETGALPTDPRAAAAEVAKTLPEMTEAARDAKATANANERAAAAEAAAAAAERAAKAAEAAAAAAKEAAAAAIAASEASQGGPVVPALD